MLWKITAVAIFIWVCPVWNSPAYAEPSPEQIQLEIDLMRGENRLSDLTREEAKLSSFVDNSRQTQAQFQTAWSDFGQLQLKVRNIFAANRLKTIFSLGLSAYQEACNAIAFGSGAALGLLNKAADWGGGQASDYGGGQYYQRSVGPLSDVAKQATPEMKKLATLLKVPPEWYAQDVGADNTSALAGIFAKMREVEAQLDKTEKALAQVEKEWRETEKRAKAQLELLRKDLDDAQKAQEGLRKRAVEAGQATEGLAAAAAAQKAAVLPKPEPPITLGSYASYDDASQKVWASYRARKDLTASQQEDAISATLTSLLKQAKDKTNHDFPLAAADLKQATETYAAAKSRIIAALQKAEVVMGDDWRPTAEELATWHAGALAPSFDDPWTVVWHHGQIRREGLPWLDKAVAAVQEGQSGIAALAKPLDEVTRGENHLQALTNFSWAWNCGYHGVEFNQLYPTGELGWIESVGNYLTTLTATLPTARDMLTKTAETYERNLPELLRPYDLAYATSSELIANADNADAQMGIARNEFNELLRVSGFGATLPGWEGVLMLDGAKLRTDLEALLDRGDEAGIEALRHKLLTMQDEIAAPVRRYKIAISQFLAYRDEIRVQSGEWQQMLITITGAAEAPGALLKVPPWNPRLLTETWPALESKRSIAWLTQPDVAAVFNNSPQLKLYELRHRVEQEGPGWMNLPAGAFNDQWNAISGEAYAVITKYENLPEGVSKSLRNAYYAVLTALNKVRDPYLLRERVARILPVLRKDVADAQQQVTGTSTQIQAAIGILEQHLRPDSEDALAKENDEVAGLLRNAEGLLPRLKDALQRAAGEKQRGDADQVKAFYGRFREAYEARDDSRIMSFMGDDWEAGDGTTLADMQVNLSRIFRQFDEMRLEIQNLQINPVPQGFMVSYDVTITSRIYKQNLRHQEKSAVNELVSVEQGGKVKIIKTLNGRYWSVD